MPADQALYTGALLIFGGRRWKVTAVDHVQKIIEVTTAVGGRPPRFDSGHGAVHDQVRARMRSVLGAGSVPRYLSAAAVSLLSEARAAYARYKLADRMTVRDGADTVLFPWAGSHVTQTLAAQLTATGLDASDDGLVITVLKADPGQVRERLHSGGRSRARRPGFARAPDREQESSQVRRLDRRRPAVRRLRPPCP